MQYLFSVDTDGFEIKNNDLDIMIMLILQKQKGIKISRKHKKDTLSNLLIAIFLSTSTQIWYSVTAWTVYLLTFSTFN